MMGTTIPTLTEVLARIAAGLMAGVILAFLFERFAWFQKLSPDAKWWVVFGVQIGLPVVATALLQFVPASVWAALEPYWQAIALGFVAWIGSQVAHRQDKARNGR
jgi:hypothetical protein